MNPTIQPKPKRVYCIYLQHSNNSVQATWSDVIRIEADCMTRHTATHLTFHREGQEVGEVKGTIAAWWVEETIPLSQEG